MRVLINKKRCDNADVCGCIAECPVNAFFYDEATSSVGVDNSLCIGCRQCMIACPAGAVKVARTDEEYEQIKTEYDSDAMTVEKLFQDRYGAEIVDQSFHLELSALDSLIDNSNIPLLIEFYNLDEADCLINSVPIQDIIAGLGIDLSYRKINLNDPTLLAKYYITSLPALLIINGGEIQSKYEGVVHTSEADTLISALK